METGVTPSPPGGQPRSRVLSPQAQVYREASALAPGSRSRRGPLVRPPSAPRGRRPLSRTRGELLRRERGIVIRTSVRARPRSVRRGTDASLV